MYDQLVIHVTSSSSPTIGDKYTYNISRELVQAGDIWLFEAAIPLTPMNAGGRLSTLETLADTTGHYAPSGSSPRHATQSAVDRRGASRRRELTP